MLLFVHVHSHRAVIGACGVEMGKMQPKHLPGTPFVGRRPKRKHPFLVEDSELDRNMWRKNKEKKMV